MRFTFTALIALLLLVAPAIGAPLDVREVNGAEWAQVKSSKGAFNPAVIKAQVLLDRARFSPGEIDGKRGENLLKAITAFAAAHDLPAERELTEDVWRKLTDNAPDPVLIEYTISKGDVRGPFAEKIPAKLEQMKHLPALSYTSPRERLAEKFHMSQELLSALNPGRKFDTAGDRIMVANVAADSLPSKAARIEVDKTAQTIRLFDREGKLLAFYPITAGSAEKPTPGGRLKVTTVRKNPTYRYNPEYAFKGVRSQEPFTIRPGPNNPVGVVWVGLSAKGYGIHGTPDPSKVSKAESNGCVRLTNWDALQLASAVARGTPVDFIGSEQAARDARAQSISGRKKKRR